MGVKNTNTSKKNEDLDKETSCFKSFEENLTYYMSGESNNSSLQVTIDEMEKCRRKIEIGFS